jgi:pimeloyl-ACP methyl ester carboxylesterase
MASPSANRRPMVLIWIAVALLGMCGPRRTALASDEHAIRQLPVAFEVRNTNRSGVPCVSDGVPYVVRGHLVGPRAALRRDGTGTVTIYLYGWETGEWNWRLKDVAGYDHAAEMARLGHVSLTIDELGYDASDHPQGFWTCMGAQADITAQIIEQLRTGAYAIGDGGLGLPFSTVVLAGHDVGGLIAEVEAYSFGGIDGLILVTYADQDFTPYIIQTSVEADLACAQGGEPAEDEPGSPSGYIHYITAEEFEDKLFVNADPAVVTAALRLRNRNPCGMLTSTKHAIAVNQLRTPEIAVPVLVVFGDDDTVVWNRAGMESQQDNFTGSDDVSTVFVPDAGHFPMFERTADLFRGALSRWLHSRFSDR